jgi:hypothetical protein
VIRPDRYILGVASNTPELDAVLARRLPTGSEQISPPFRTASVG